MPVVWLNVSNNFEWVFQSIGVLSVQPARLTWARDGGQVFRVQGVSAVGYDPEHSHYLRRRNNDQRWFKVEANFKHVWLVFTQLRPLAHIGVTQISIWVYNDLFMVNCVHHWISQRPISLDFSGIFTYFRKKIKAGLVRLGDVLK